jgi:hypothetical protein
MDKIYQEFARQHLEGMSVDELRGRLTEVQELLDELHTNSKKPNTHSVNIDYVIERLTDILIGDLNVK